MVPYVARTSVPSAYDIKTPGKISTNKVNEGDVNIYQSAEGLL